MPLRLFVVNNGGYASIRATQRNYFEGRYVGSGPQAKLDIPDLVTLARAFGWDAFAIDRVEDLRAGIARALESDGPLLVDVRVVQDEGLFPKSAALPQPDGSMLSTPSRTCRRSCRATSSGPICWFPSIRPRSACPSTSSRARSRRDEAGGRRRPAG